MRARIETVEVYLQYLRDARRYARLRTPLDWRLAERKGPRYVECQVVRDYHQVEKGLALPLPRRPFGAEVGERLEVLTQAADAISDYMDCGRDALAALRSWNGEGVLDDAVVPLGKPGAMAGPDVDALEAFFGSRHSVRNFEPNAPSVELLDRAVRIAMRSPSVCNRQASRVDFFYGHRAQELLALQHGNRGFGDTVPCVAVVSVDARLFRGTGERNQRWIDGGIFAMSLVWGLHAVGLSSCMLNWSRTEGASRRLRAAAALEDHFDVITFVAVGHAAAGTRVTRSARRPLSQVSFHHE